MRNSFLAPPADAKPAIWWFWGESVTTDHGITQDLEALKRVGFGGVVVYEQLFTDRPGALKSLSPEWLGRIRFAAAECARLGLTLEVNVGNGYVAGGPWITPALGMQRLVASETVVEGGSRISVVLPQAPAKLGYYRDVAVLAYSTPAGSGIEALPKPDLTSDPGGVDFDGLFSKDGKRSAVIPPTGEGKPVFVQLDYRRPKTARSLTYSTRTRLKAPIIATQVPSSWADGFLGQNMRAIPQVGKLEASDDGHEWRVVCEMPGMGTQHDWWTQQTIAFPAATARYFRLKLDVTDGNLTIGGLELNGEARVDEWERKSGNVVDFSDPDHTPEYAEAEVIRPESVLDLTKFTAPDGTLRWDAPPGRWTILRLGHTPTGAKTKHGRPEALGLECDKLSAAATKVQFDNYVGVILHEIRKVPGGKLSGINIDSAEHGSQNWTDDFEAQFEKRRGYSPRRFLPVMMGRVVGGREQSDKFLFDVRRTIADLMSDEYYGTFQRLCHAEGMTSMAQAPGIATCLPSDNIQAKGRTDIPMGEFWMSQPDGTIDCKETASAAHVYGLPVAAAESFTGSPSDVCPATMKPFADAALAQGINRFVVLAYVHQPWDDRLPGVTQDRFYLAYQRHNTWWEYSTGFWQFLTRSSQLMREGHPVADVLYHLGDDTPLKIATSRLRPVPPAGYDYDVCGDEALISRAKVKDGRIVLPDGMGYRMLILAGGSRMTLAAARHLEAMVRDGAAVFGPVKPSGSPSLSDGAEGKAEVKRIADDLWGAGPIAGKGDHRTGAGRMMWGMTPAQALASLGCPPDFEIVGGNASAKLIHAHRRAGGADVYFVANHELRPTKVIVAFRVTGSVPERWDPDTGNITILPVTREEGGRTDIALTLEANESTFVVFGSERRETSGTIPQSDGRLVAEKAVVTELTGPWNVSFTAGRGAPAQAVFPKLISWSRHDDPGVRFFSGEATYTKDFQVPAPLPTQRVTLDLGKVSVLASVTLNGHDLGVAWKEPYVLDATGALKEGRNTLVVRVVNTWANRLIGDSGLPGDKRVTWTTFNPFHSGDALEESGLLGPVSLRR